MEKEMPIGLRFSLLHRSFKKQLDEQLKEKELTGVQFGVLGQLGRLERSGQGEVYQKDLELATHVTHPTMTEIIKRLHAVYIHTYTFLSQKFSKLRISSSSFMSRHIKRYHSHFPKTFQSFINRCSGLVKFTIFHPRIPVFPEINFLMKSSRRE